MTSAAIVSAFALLQQGVLAAMWLTLSAVGVWPRACRAWAMSSTALGLSFALSALRPGMTPWIGYGVAHLLSIVAVLLLHLGIERFAKRPARPMRHAALLAASVALGAAALAAGRPWLVVALNSAVFALVLGGCVAVVLGLQDELRPPPAAAFAAPLAVLAVAQALRAGRTLLVGPTIPVVGHDDPGTALVVIIIFLCLSLVLNIAVVAMVTQRLVGRLRHRGDHDALTGLANRHVVEARLTEQRSLLQRHGTPHALLSVDVDRFKSINDRFGHPAGDEALRAIAQALREHCRAHDLPARCGGEEFWVLMPHTALEGAVQLAERIVAAVRRLDVPAAGPMTVSIGVAVADDPAEPSERLLQRADAALYEAKHSGRDRFVVDTPTPTRTLTAPVDPADPADPAVWPRHGRGEGGGHAPG